MKIVYKDPTFRLKDNGWISRTCQLNTECPIFANLYLFVAEILSERIKNVTGTEGFQYKNSNKEMKHVQHVDDICMTLSLKNIYSLSHAVNTINLFCKHAGSRIILKK